MPENHPIPFENNPLWYKDVTIYELHVRGFCDSNGDGIGDFPGGWAWERAQSADRLTRFSKAPLRN